MPFSVYARGDSSTANNASLNVQGTSTVPTTLLTFSAASPTGDEKLEFNGGLPDPDTIVYLDGDLGTAYTFTLEFGGYLPNSNKLADVNGTDLRGEEILVLTLSTGQRYFFVIGSDGSATWLGIMDAFPNGAHSIGITYACYLAGTRIDTPTGPRPIEDIAVGDLVTGTAERPVPVRMIARRDYTADEVRAFVALRPLVLPAGSLGPGVPWADLTVSALHRILVRDAAVERLFGFRAAYVAARDLPDARPAPVRALSYLHLLCDAHECLTANGCPSESLYPGDVALASLGPAERARARAIAGDTARPTAYPCLTAREAAVWRDAVRSGRSRSA